MGALQGGIVDKALAGVRGSFLVVGLFSLFINVAALILPLYMLQIYNRVLPAHSVETLVALTLLALGLLVIVGMVEIARSRVLVRVGSEIDEVLGPRIFDATISDGASLAEGSASQPMRDLDAVRTFMTGAGILAFFDAPWTPIYLAIVFMLHPVLGAVATVGALIIFALAVASDIAVRAPLREAGQSARWSNELIEIFSRSTRSILSLGMRGRLEAMWQSHRRSGVAWQALASDRMGILQSTAKSMRMALQILILGAGAWLALRDEITPGVIFAASLIMGRALAPVEAALGQWRSFVNARAAHRRLEAVLAGALERTRERMALPPPKGRIEVDKASLRIAAVSEPVLASVSFSVEAGTTLGIVGPSGAGKSTLARLLVGLEAPTLGSVRLDGVEVSTWPKEDLGPHIGFLPQEIELLGGTVAQNISRFEEYDSEKIVGAATLVGAHEMILQLPDGYDTLVAENGRNLSGGQRQRIGLARAFLGAPRFVVLDEPNANLDADGETALTKALEVAKQRGSTLVVISHKPSMLAGADKLLVLSAGRLKLFGPAMEVLAEMAAQAGGRTRPPSVSPILRRGSAPPLETSYAKQAPAKP